jgi:hypothetical protein
LDGNQVGELDRLLGDHCRLGALLVAGRLVEQRAISSPALRTTTGVTPVTLGRTGERTTTARVPIRYPNSRDLPVKAGEWPSALTVAKSGCLQAFPYRIRRCTHCLPCRRSWVRIPSAALGKVCICRPFSSRQRDRASASLGTESGLASRPPWETLRKNLLSRHLLRARTTDLLRGWKRSKVRCELPRWRPEHSGRRSVGLLVLVQLGRRQ